MDDQRLSKDDLTLLLGVLDNVKIQGNAIDRFMLLRNKLRYQLMNVEKLSVVGKSAAV